MFRLKRGEMIAGVLASSRSQVSRDGSRCALGGACCASLLISVELIAGHALFGLNKEGLIEGFAYGNKENLRKPKPGFVFTDDESADLVAFLNAL